MNFINLTPHTIVVLDINDETVLSVPSSGNARVQNTLDEQPPIGGIPCHKVGFGEVEGLPEAQPDTTYIVSAFVLSALNGTRADVVAPNTSPVSAVRNEKGHIIGVRGFSV